MGNALRAFSNRLRLFFLWFVKPQEKAVVSKPKREKVENFGTWYYLDDILDCLENYFIYLKMFRKHDRETYLLYSQVGGQIVPDKMLCETLELTASWRNGSERPGFGLVHMNDSRLDDKDTIHVKLLYFRKYKAKEDVQLPFSPR